MIGTRLLSSALLAAALGLLPACASDGGGGGGTLHMPDVGEWDPGSAEPATGNVRVTHKNLDPKRPDALYVLVNESSEVGRRLSSGRASSTVIRVLTDQQMGDLLAKMDELEFFEHATPGLGPDDAPAVAGQKGIVAVERNGRKWGLLLARNMGGTPVPATYVDCKGLVMRIHAELQGFEIRTGTGGGDADDVFKGPPIRSPNRLEVR